MDENTTKMIKERFDALPESIQELITSSGYQNILVEIGKKYQLNVEQLGMLEQETTLVMMGLTPTKDFETELTRELHVDKMKGNQIVTEINEKIFVTIRDLLKLMYTPEGEEPSVEETPEEKGLSSKTLPRTFTENLETREEMLKHIENSGSILSQKLSGSFQIPKTETDHSIENITKNTNTADSGVAKNLPKVDPYREIPE